MTENEPGMRGLLVLALASIIVGGTVDLYLDRPTHWLTFHVIFGTLMIAGALLMATTLWLGWWRAERSVAKVTGRSERTARQHASAQVGGAPARPDPRLTLLPAGCLKWPPVSDPLCKAMAAGAAASTVRDPYVGSSGRPLGGVPTFPFVILLETGRRTVDEHRK